MYIKVIRILIVCKYINCILIKSKLWGLGIGDWGLGNPQSPIPNPQFVTK